jgi:hypothetical protein
MKFVCLNCETYMNLEKVEKPFSGKPLPPWGMSKSESQLRLITRRKLDPDRKKMEQDSRVAIGLFYADKLRSAPATTMVPHGLNRTEQKAVPTHVILAPTALRQLHPLLYARHGRELMG